MKSRLLWLAVLAAALAGFYEGTLGTARRSAPPVVDFSAPAVPAPTAPATPAPAPAPKA